MLFKGALQRQHTHPHPLDARHSEWPFRQRLTRMTEELVFRQDLKRFFTQLEIEEVRSCPMALKEQIKEQFRGCDQDNSGFIDESELMELMKSLNVDISEEKLGDMVQDIDVDGNGLVDFDEFVMMIHKAKDGDPRFAMIADFAKGMQSTPVSVLESEAGTHLFLI